MFSQRYRTKYSTEYWLQVSTLQNSKFLKLDSFQENTRLVFPYPNWWWVLEAFKFLTSELVIGCDNNKRVISRKFSLIETCVHYMVQNLISLFFFIMVLVHIFFRFLIVRRLFTCISPWLFKKKKLVQRPTCGIEYNQDYDASRKLDHHIDHKQGYEVDHSQDLADCDENVDLVSDAEDSGHNLLDCHAAHACHLFRRHHGGHIQLRLPCPTACCKVGK